MKKSFITFWKDMWESQKVTNRFFEEALERIYSACNSRVRYRVCIAMCDCKSKRFYRN